MLVSPSPPKAYLVVFISATSVHELPSHDSTFAVDPPGASPPKFNAAVCVPAPAAAYLAVFNSATSVHEVPFQDSVRF